MLDKTQAAFAGQLVVDLLNLKPGSNGLYETDYGSKSVAGIGRLVESIIETAKQSTLDDLKY